MNLKEQLDWLPIELAARDLDPKSNQVVLIYNPNFKTTFLKYRTCGPEYVIRQAVKDGYTLFAILVGV